MRARSVLSLASLPLLALACGSSPAGSPGGSGGKATTSASGGQATTSHTTSDGGESTGGHGGAATGGTGGADPCATAFFCDDFEGYAVGAPPSGSWQASESHGSAVVDTGRAKSGQNAVKISADAVSGYRSVMISLTDPSRLPTPTGELYGRMMFYLESAPEGTVHWTFIAGSGPVPGQGYHAIYRYGGQHPISDNGSFVGSQLMANYETPDSYQSPPVGPGSDCWQHANKDVVPTGKWACAEWRFDTNDSAMELFIDGVEVQSLAVQGVGQGCVHQDASFPWLAPSFERISLGWESYQADDARVMWIDDVALSTTRIGCP
jgi:hypothetical protein